MQLEILSHFCVPVNISKTLRINFYQNPSSIVKVMIKNFCGSHCI